MAVVTRGHINRGETAGTLHQPAADNREGGEEVEDRNRRGSTNKSEEPSIYVAQGLCPLS